MNIFSKWLNMKFDEYIYPYVDTIKKENKEEKLFLLNCIEELERRVFILEGRP